MLGSFLPGKQTLSKLLFSLIQFLLLMRVQKRALIGYLKLLQD